MKPYLIIGSGRLARHFSFYLKALDIPYLSWQRNSSIELIPLIEKSSRVLLAIRDDAIENFLAAYPSIQNKNTVHFSGARQFPEISSAHPLMTFGDRLYSTADYRRIPFIIEPGTTLSEILPQIPNPSFCIPAEKRALYHALCVFSGNFTTILWETATKLFSQELDLPPQALLPYLEKTCENLASSLPTTNSTLTGPFARRDTQTIVRNLDALVGRPEQDLYYAFLNYTLKTQSLSQGEFHERSSV